MINHHYPINHLWSIHVPNHQPIILWVSYGFPMVFPLVPIISLGDNHLVKPPHAAYAIGLIHGEKAMCHRRHGALHGRYGTFVGICIYIYMCTIWLYKYVDTYYMIINIHIHTYIYTYQMIMYMYIYGYYCDYIYVHICEYINICYFILLYIDIYVFFFKKKTNDYNIYIWLYKYGYINIYVITNDYKWLFINMFFLIYILYIYMNMNTWRWGLGCCKAGDFLIGGVGWWVNGSGAGGLSNL